MPTISYLAVLYLTIQLRLYCYPLGSHIVMLPLQLKADWRPAGSLPTAFRLTGEPSI